jgi:VIT1/CCC1 family predicted Fe2+/Mn2+ transporter
MDVQERYRRRMAAERDAAVVYRALADRRQGEERELLLGLARAEERHAEHWARLIEGDPQPRRPTLRGRLLSFLARRVWSLLVLALVQRAELRDPEPDEHAPDAIIADERVHALVVSQLARRRRAQASGTLRAAVFGASDGLVSNLSLILGVWGAGVSSEVVLLTGLAGLLAGALSMAAGEYVSVRSQRELIDAAAPDLDPAALAALRDAEVHELALAFRAEGLALDEAERRAAALLDDEPGGEPASQGQPEDVVGSAVQAAGSSFAAFALGALVPVLPFFAVSGTPALVTGAALAAIALFATGALTAVLSGGPLLRRGFRQLLIGLLAAAVTYGLGAALGVALA